MTRLTITRSEVLALLSESDDALTYHLADMARAAGLDISQDDGVIWPHDYTADADQVSIQFDYYGSVKFAVINNATLPGQRLVDSFTLLNTRIELIHELLDGVFTIDVYDSVAEITWTKQFDVYGDAQAEFNNLAGSESLIILGQKLTDYCA
jgi:hypothetical protein